MSIIKKILLTLFLIGLFTSCNTYRLIYVLDFEDGTAEYTFRGYSNYILFISDSALFEVNDKVKLDEINKYRNK